MSDFSNGPESYDEITGARRAAMLLLSLPEEISKSILSQLDESEVHMLTLHMTQLGLIPGDHVDRLYEDFIGQISQTGSQFGSMESTERLLNKVFDSDKASRILEEIRGPAGRRCGTN